MSKLRRAGAYIRSTITDTASYVHTLGFCTDSLAEKFCLIVVNALGLNIKRQDREVSALQTSSV